MEEEDRGRVWRLYGWYSALMACSSCVGAVTWSARMMFFENNFKGNVSSDRVQKASLLALACSWRAAFNVAYDIEFLCLSAAILMVLDRMSAFAAPQGSRLHKRWAAAGRIVMAVVVLGNAVGLAASAPGTVHIQNAAEALSTASAYYTANNTKDGDDFFSLSEEELQRGDSIVSVQLFCEVAVRLLIVFAFVAVGVLSARRVNSTLLGVDAASAAASAAAATGRALRLRMVGTTTFVFVTFVVRAVFCTMFAVAYQLRDIGKKCRSESSACDSSCYNVYSLITQWMIYTPEVGLITVLVSSPLALLVALWGMTPKATLYLMKSRKRDRILPGLPVESVPLQ